MTVSHVVFVILSAVALIGAVGVVASRNLFRAALFLVLSFIGVEVPVRPDNHPYVTKFYAVISRRRDFAINEFKTKPI